MAFDINTFRSKFEKYGGASRTSLFLVEIYKPNKKSEVRITPEEMRFFCKSVTFPGINLDITENRPYGVGMPVRYPSGATAQDVNAIFMLDSNHQILGFFHSWIQDVFNYQATNLAAANKYSPNQAVYELGYFNDYSCNIRIKYFSSHSSEAYYECLLEGAYPTQVGSVELSWDSNDQYGVLPVSFAFEKISFSGNASGPIQGINSRGFGLIDYIISIGQIGQTIESIKKPKSVQDAINMFTNVAYTWDNLRNLFSSWRSETCHCLRFLRLSSLLHCHRQVRR